MRTEKETMHKVIFTFISIFISFSLNSQIKGSVVDAKNNALPFVNIYLKNSLSGTISNDNGFYELNLKTTGTHTIIFQFLGFKTLEKTVDIQQFPFQLNVKMDSEDVLLQEVALSSKENPAIAIIKNVIVNKERHTNKSGKYTADV